LVDGSARMVERMGLLNKKPIRGAQLLSMWLFVVVLILAGCRDKDPDLKSYAQFYDGIFHGQYDTVKRLLRKYPSLIHWEFNFAGHQADPLMTAALANDPKMIELLLKAGAEPNYYADDGVSPLMVAVEHERVEIAEQLLGAGADVNRKAVDGSTVLHYLGVNGNLQIAGLLLPKVKNIDEPKDGGFTALTVALSKYHNELAFRLIRHGASLKKALDPAPHIIPEYVLNDNREMLEYFWQQGVINPCAVYQSNNLFHYAVWYNNIEFVRDLVSRGLWDYSTNHDGETPLDIARRMKHNEIIKLVTDAGLAK